MTIELPSLPYPENALEPHLSRETLQYHHGKHHAGYVDALNEGLADSELADYKLEDLVQVIEGELFNPAAQAWNHAFYWQCMTPESGTAPGAALQQAIDSSFGSMDKLREAFTTAASDNFASGWTWLVKDNSNRLMVMNTDDADTPLRRAGLTPLLTTDVWEHAYYIDYRNARGDYLDAFWELVNWEFVASNFQ